MKQVSFWAVLILIAVGLQILGRISSPAKPTKKTEPASVSKIEGTELKRLTLLPEAVRRWRAENSYLLNSLCPGKQRNEMSSPTRQCCTMRKAIPGPTQTPNQTCLSGSQSGLKRWWETKPC